MDWLDNERVAEILVDAMGAYDEIIAIDLDGCIVARTDNQIDIIDWVVTQEDLDVDLELGMDRKMFERLLDKCVIEFDIPGGCNVGHALAQIHIRGNTGIIKLVHYSSWER